MKAYLKFRYVFLAMLTCMILNSCSKDTDLLSEYLIREAEKNEVSSVSERTDDLIKTTNIQVSNKQIVK
jgi:hypothetical protein